MDTKQVVTNYHNAWTIGDVEAARVYLMLRSFVNLWLGKPPDNPS